MKKILIGILLFIIAYSLFIPLSIINVLVVAISDSFKNVGGYFEDSAYRLDVYSCAELRSLWNKLFITKDGVKFGKSGKSISHDLGMNEFNGTLSLLGKAMVWILDKIEKDHCKKAYACKQ